MNLKNKLTNLMDKLMNLKDGKIIETAEISGIFVRN